MSELSDTRVILFDLDGTLIDSVPQLYLAVQHALTEIGQEKVTLEDVRTWIGNGAAVLLKRAYCRQYHYEESSIDPSHFQAMKIAFDEHYTKGIDQNYELYPAVKETLSALKNAGYEMAVVTNKPDAFVQPLLKAAGIADYFSYTLGGGILSVHKPAPEPLFYLCDKFDVQPSQALMVGDSKNDIEAARAAGMPVVGLTYGYNHGEPIEHSQPDWVLNHFDELAGLLKVNALRN